MNYLSYSMIYLFTDYVGLNHSHLNSTIFPPSINKHDLAPAPRQVKSEF